MKKGFTLIELMIIIAILGIMAAIIIPQSIKSRQRLSRGTAELPAEQLPYYFTPTGYVELPPPGMSAQPGEPYTGPREADPVYSAAEDTLPRYAELLKTIDAPLDRDTYGRYFEPGLLEINAWPGQENLPRGYWVYEYPEWKIYAKKKRTDVAGVSKYLAPPESYSYTAPAITYSRKPVDISGLIRKESNRNFTTFRFTGILSAVRALTVTAGEHDVWIGTSAGLVRYVLKSGQWLFYPDSPADYIDHLAICDTYIAADITYHTAPGGAYGAGVYLFDPEKLKWFLQPPGFSAWDLHYEHGELWAAGRGIQRFKPVLTIMEAEREPRHYTAENSALLHNSVSAIAVGSRFMWFGMHGDYVKDSNDFSGGGVSRLDRVTGEWRSYPTETIRSYCCDIDADEREVWAAHWHEEIGLSYYDIAADQWHHLIKSVNGVEVGGVKVKLDGNTVWIGQQGALVRLDRESKEAVRYLESDGLPGYIVSGLALNKTSLWASVYGYGQNGWFRSGVVSFARK